MKEYATIEEAIAEARRQSIDYSQGFVVPRNLVIRTENGFAAHSVGNSLMLEFCREHQLVGEIVGYNGRYVEFNRWDLRANGCLVAPKDNREEV